MSDSEKETKVVFKTIKKKNVRQRKKSSDEEVSGTEENIEVESKLELITETKEKQKLRQRKQGVNAASLALGKKITIEEEVSVKDPYNAKTGGMVNMTALKAGKLKAASDDAFDTGIGTQFSAETNIGDTDEEMIKYVEEQLKKKKGIEVDSKEKEANKYLTPEEAAILALPAHLRETSTKKSEEMLSNQMLNGIPEIDLGIESKIKNIEATEEAKQQLLADQKSKKDLPSHFVPVNLAVNFANMQHNRFNIDQTAAQKRRQQDATSSDQQRNNSKQPKKATDDYHFDKFKKQFRRH